MDSLFLAHTRVKLLYRKGKCRTPDDGESESSNPRRKSPPPHGEGLINRQRYRGKYKDIHRRRAGSCQRSISTSTVLTHALYCTVPRTLVSTTGMMGKACAYPRNLVRHGGKKVGG